MAIFMSKEEREEKLASKIDIKWRTYTYANWLLVLEYRSFGWAYCGKESEVVDDGYETTVSRNYATTRHKTHIVKYACFKRPQGYRKNFLFSLLEVLSGILSRVRVWALNFVIIAVIIAAIAQGETAAIIGGVYAGLIGASILVSILGSVVRNVFKLDEATDEFNHKYGYQGHTDFIKDNDVRFGN